MIGGRLRKRLQFQSQSGTPNEFGEVTTYTTYYTCWGEIDVLNNKMNYQTDAFISESTYKCIVRYPWLQTINPGDRILYQPRPSETQTFVIDAVTDPEFKHVQLSILCHVLNESN